MYIILGIIICLLIVVNVVYFFNKNKITKELTKIEKENGTLNKKKKKIRGNSVWKRNIIEY